MALAWAPVAIVLLLMPGVFFFIGLASYERFSREIVRSSVVSEVALATVIAIGIHFVSTSLLSTTGFRLSQFVAPLVDFTHADFVKRVADKLTPAILYLAITTACGFIFGVLVARGVVSGRFRRLAKHRWVYDVIDVDRRGGIVTAYVMTTLVEDSHILMYKGRVHDIFLISDGTISYLVLKNCFRYCMTIKDEKLATSKQFELFGSQQGVRPPHAWDRLLIDGKNISNVLFDSSHEITGQAEGIKALDDALHRLEVAQRMMRSEMKRAEGKKGKKD